MLAGLERVMFLWMGKMMESKVMEEEIGRNVGTMVTGTCHIMIQLAAPASHTKDDTSTVITPTQYTHNAK